MRLAYRMQSKIQPVQVRIPSQRDLHPPIQLEVPLYSIIRFTYSGAQGIYQILPSGLGVLCWLAFSRRLRPAVPRKVSPRRGPRRGPRMGTTSRSGGSAHVTPGRCAPVRDKDGASQFIHLPSIKQIQISRRSFAGSPCLDGKDGASQFNATLWEVPALHVATSERMRCPGNVACCLPSLGRYLQEWSKERSAGGNHLSSVEKRCPRNDRLTSAALLGCGKTPRVSSRPLPRWVTPGASLPGALSLSMVWTLEPFAGPQAGRSTRLARMGSFSLGKGRPARRRGAGRGASWPGRETSE
jgi:hypothetical protein